MDEVGEKIEQMIRDCFPDNVPFENGRIERSSAAEAVARSKILGDRPWGEIEPRQLILSTDSPFFLSAQAFAFYLPAYLLVIINNFGEADLLPCNVVERLSCKFEEGVAISDSLQIVAVLNNKQKTAIAQALLYLYGLHADSRFGYIVYHAIVSYWGTYLVGAKSK